jgi:hypothetical protein
MNKLRLIILFAFMILLGFQTDIKAQETEITGSEITINKMRLPVLPNDKKPNYNSFDDEAAIIISEVVKQLRLYDILVGIYIDSTSVNLDSTITKGMVVDFKYIEEFSEAIVITAANISQKSILQGEDEEFPDNISTEIKVLSYFINIETGEFLGSFDVEAAHLGGSREESKTKALKTLKQKVTYELERIYLFSSDILSTNNGIITLQLGTDHGIEKGMIFDIIEPDRAWKVDDGELIVPGGRVGHASVVDTAKDSSSLQVLRQWQNHYEGSWVVEHPNKIYALQLSFVPPLIDSYFNFGIYFNARPIHNFDWGLGMHINQVPDSFGENNFGIGLAGFGIWRFLNMSRFDIGGKLGIDLDIPFKKDDDGQTVYTTLFSAHIGIVAEFPLSPKSDFVFSAGYRFGVKSDEWEFSEDEETYPAFWENGSPEVDNSGFMLSFGYKYLLF